MCHLLLRQQHGFVAFHAALVTTDCNHAPINGHSLGQNHLDVFDHALHPRFSFKLLDAVCSVALQTVIQPVLWAWICHGKAIELQDQLGCALIVFSRRICLHKIQKGFTRLLILLLKKCLEHVRLQKFQLTLIGDAKARIEFDFLKMLAKHRQAKTVDCGDMRMTCKHFLTAQVRIIWLLLHALCNCRLHTLTHLARRCVCKGHHKKAVNVNRV